MKLRLLLVNCMMLSALISYAGYPYTGPCGAEYGKPSVQWTFSENGIQDKNGIQVAQMVLTFSGDGNIMNCGPDVHPFYSHSGYNGFYSLKFTYHIPLPYSTEYEISVVYEDGVTSTGRYFFYSPSSSRDNYGTGNYDPLPGDRYHVSSVKLSPTISEIGDFSFYGCLGLTEIDFEGLPQLTIGNRAFGWTSIKKMFIPDNVILKRESLMRCPLEQVIITNPVPTVEKSYIGQYGFSYGYFQDTNEPVTDVFVPDVEAYGAWEPMPKPMLKEGRYSLEDAALGNITIVSNIPGYEASTDYCFDQLEEGIYTVSLPVKFTGEKEFETTVKYTYTVGNPSTSINNVTNNGFSVKSSGDMIVISGNTEPIVIFNITGQKVYEGTENQIRLPQGMYLVNTGGRTVKIKL